MRMIGHGSNPRVQSIGIINVLKYSHKESDLGECRALEPWSLVSLGDESKADYYTK